MFIRFFSLAVFLLLSHSLFIQAVSAKQRTPTQIPSLYKVSSDSESYYEDNSGQYRITGTLLDLGGTAYGIGEDLPVEKVMQNAKGKFGQIMPDEIRKTPIKGVYELLFGKLVKYMDGSGRFMFRGGELLDQTSGSLTLAARTDAARNVAQGNLALLSQIPEEEMIIYKADEEKHVLTVFTDTNCIFCRKFHKDIPEYNQRGVTVRYLFFPREGLSTTSHKVAVSVWCNPEQKAALNRAEMGVRIQPARCPNPIDKHYALAQQLNLLGTPVTILESGEMVYGYLHPTELITKLMDQSYGLALR